MDPNETLRRIDTFAQSPFLTDVERDEHDELCEALYGWLINGGFQPSWALHPTGTTAYHDWKRLRDRHAAGLTHE